VAAQRAHPAVRAGDLDQPCGAPQAKAAAAPAEIDKIERRVNERGLTIVPLSLYFKDGRAKVEIALARGKKSWDKRHALAERQATREVEQAVGRRLKGMRD
jgi:tmRNA-binding protein